MRFVLLLPLFLAACSLPQDDSPQAQCERQANNDPAVRELYNSNANAQLWTQWPPDKAALDVARRQAVLKCMQQKGLAPPGGVQPVRQQ